MSEKLTAIINVIAKVALDAAATIERSSLNPLITKIEKRVLRALAKLLQSLAAEAKKGNRKAIVRLCSYLDLKELRSDYDSERNRIKELEKSKLIADKRPVNTFEENKKINEKGIEPDW